MITAPAAPSSVTAHGTAKFAGSPQFAIAARVTDVKSHPASAPAGKPAATPARAVYKASSVSLNAIYSRVAPTA
jgi:hypothetical protein